MLPFHKASVSEETGDAIGRLRALGEPGLGLLEVDLDALLVGLAKQRIVGADLLDETAIARKARVGDHDVVVWAVPGAAARETDFQ